MAANRAFVFIACIKDAYNAAKYKTELNEVYSGYFSNDKLN